MPLRVRPETLAGSSPYATSWKSFPTDEASHSETATRQILAKETEKIAVEINFRIARESKRQSGLTPIWDAIRDSGSNLAESLATLIMVIVAVIPWLVVLVLAFWLLRKLWRKRRGQIS
jgi:hypothetical protein